MVYDVIVNGLSTVGKDTFIDFVNEESNKNISVDNVSSIDPFRKMPYDFGWSGNKDESYRKCLSLLKEASTHINNFPTKYLVEMRERFIRRSECSDKVIFYHIREPNEIDELRALLPRAKVVLVRGSESSEASMIDIDRVVFNYIYDVVVLNTGTLDELRESAQTFLEELLA